MEIQGFQDKLGAEMLVYLLANNSHPTDERHS